MIQIVWGALFLLAAAGTAGGLYLHFVQDRQQTIRQQLEATVEGYRAEAGDTKATLTAVTEQLAEALAMAQAQRAQLESQTGDTKALMVARLEALEARLVDLLTQTDRQQTIRQQLEATVEGHRAEAEDTKVALTAVTDQLAEALAMSQAQRAQLRKWTERANGVGEP